MSEAPRVDPSEVASDLLAIAEFLSWSNDKTDRERMAHVLSCLKVVVQVLEFELTLPEGKA